MNAITKPVFGAREKAFGGDLQAYLGQFFGGEIPPEALEIESWGELQHYLAGFVNTALPAPGGVVEHRVYGFEKEHVLSMLFKQIFY